MTKLLSILLVDDDKTTNFVNQLLLEDMEVTRQVLVSLNGLQALELLRQVCNNSSCPELILLDINMPVMNGFEFLKAYQGLEFAHKQSVIIVMLTTSLNPKDIEQINLFPIKGFLSKPLTEEKVRALLHTHFNQDLPA